MALQDLKDLRELRQRREDIERALHMKRAFDTTHRESEYANYPRPLRRMTKADTKAHTRHLGHTPTPMQLRCKRDRGIAGLIRQLRGRN